MVKKSKMTIKDIAALAGVSTMTVSRVINSPHLVRPVTLERVRRIMEKHYYVYDAGAADLVKKRSALIGLLAGPSKNIARVKAALAGYRAALRDHNINYDSSLVITRNNNMIGGKEAANKLLSLPEIPSAIFVAGGILQAIGALMTAREKGLKVPRDISIAASGDVDLAAMTDPPLTAIRIPMFDVGQLAVEMLTETIESNLKEVRQFCFDSDLIVRESCCEAKS